MKHAQRVAAIFAELGVTAKIQGGDLQVSAPADGSVIAALAPDTSQTLEEKVAQAKKAQARWSARPRRERAALIERLAASIKEKRALLAELVTLEAGKTQKEALGEVDGSADTLLKTLKDAALPEINGMLRDKERPPTGIVGLITSFNFPIVVAHWTLAPALLAGNAVLWKPSEKTPLVALALKAVFDKTAGHDAALLQLLIGEREIGAALVAHENVDMISATGSVTMGQGIKKTLAAKKNNAVKPVLELGGNNGAIISGEIDAAHLEWSLAALLTSFLGTTGQRCTNTRRLIVHKNIGDQAVAILLRHLETFIAGGAIVSPLFGASNEFGYGPLIDAHAYKQFEDAKRRAVEEGGQVMLGKRLLASDYPQAFYVEPALALLPSQSKLMHEEVFAPILFIVPYDGDIAQAVALLNAPDNAGLVSGIYTQSQREADYFAAKTQAGHGVINSPKGTGTPAYGMGFGGNKASGEGEILNAADPLRPFTRDTHFTRIAQNKDVKMDKE